MRHVYASARMCCHRMVTEAHRDNKGPSAGKIGLSNSNSNSNSNQSKSKSNSNSNSTSTSNSNSNSNSYHISIGGRPGPSGHDQNPRMSCTMQAFPLKPKGFLAQSKTCFQNLRIPLPAKYWPGPVSHGPATRETRCPIVGEGQMGSAGVSTNGVTAI